MDGRGRSWCGEKWPALSPVRMAYRCSTGCRLLGELARFLDGSDLGDPSFPHWGQCGPLFIRAHPLVKSLHMTHHEQWLLIRIVSCIFRWRTARR